MKGVREDKWEAVFKVNGGVQKVMTAHKSCESWINRNSVQCSLEVSARKVKLIKQFKGKCTMFTGGVKDSSNLIGTGSLQCICVIGGLEWKRLNNQGKFINNVVMWTGRSHFQWSNSKVHHWRLSKTWIYLHVGKGTNWTSTGISANCYC